LEEHGVDNNLLSALHPDDEPSGLRGRRATDIVCVAAAVLYPAWHWAFLAVAPASQDPLAERIALGALILLAALVLRLAGLYRLHAVLDELMAFALTGHYLSIAWRNHFSTPYLIGLYVVFASISAVLSRLWIAVLYAGMSISALLVMYLRSEISLSTEVESVLGLATVLVSAVVGTHKTTLARRTALANIAQSRAILRNIIEAIPDPVFVRSWEMTLLLANDAGRRFENATGYDLSPVSEQELAAIAARRTLEQDLDVRTSFGNLSMSVKTAVASFPTGPPLVVTIMRDVTERRAMAESLRLRLRELEEARERVRRLQQMLPICMHCSKIRVADGEWETLETYVAETSHASFTHTLCNRCLEQHYPA
jgi:PAS domain-containing protein